MSIIPVGMKWFWVRCVWESMFVCGKKELGGKRMRERERDQERRKKKWMVRNKRVTGWADIYPFLPLFQQVSLFSISSSFPLSINLSRLLPLSHDGQRIPVQHYSFREKERCEWRNEMKMKREEAEEREWENEENLMRKREKGERKTGRGWRGDIVTSINEGRWRRGEWFQKGEKNLEKWEKE